MHNNNKLMNCRICGYENFELPWGKNGDVATFDFCDCCGVQFGYQDCKLEGVLEYRKKWLKEGAVWDQAHLKPVDWDLNKQLDNIPIFFKGNEK